MSQLSSEQIDKVVGVYVASRDAGDDYTGRTEVVKGLASANKVSENVIRGVLVTNEVYKAKESSGATKNQRVDKEAIIKAIEAAYGVGMKSMRNMNTKDLVAFWDKIKESIVIAELK